MLMLAAKSGRLQCAQELLRRWGAPVLVEIASPKVDWPVWQVNSVNERGCTPLVLAAMKGG